MLGPLCVLLLLQLAAGTNVPSSVLQLSDKFIEVKDDGYWFVEFYAPWCAHCKRLSPVWEHVGHALADSAPNVRIAKMDCTQYSKACHSVDVTGYPTLLFFRNGQIVRYEGEREKEAMIDFVLKCAAPTVTPISTLVQYNEIREASKKEPLFLHVEGQGDETALADAYKTAASSLFSRTRFYSLPERLAPLNLKKGSIYVLRDSVADRFDGEPDDVSRWVAGERLPVVAKASGVTLGALAQSEKLLVLIVADQVDRRNASTAVGAFFTVATDAARAVKADRELRSHFQFAWLDGGSMASNIVMQHVDPPFLLVLNYSSYEYFLPIDAPSEMTKESLVLWLRQTVLSPDAKPLGGKSLWTRVQRLVYETYTNVAHMFTTQPILSCCLFGVPLAFLSIITYSLCSADFTVDRDEIYPDDEDEGELEGEEEEEEGESNQAYDEDHEKAE